MIDYKKHRERLKEHKRMEWAKHRSMVDSFEYYFAKDAEELLNDSEELQNIRKLAGDALSVGRTLGEQRDQYRRGIKVLDKLLHDTDSIDVSAWNKILDGMTLHDYLWEAGQHKGEEEG